MLIRRRQTSWASNLTHDRRLYGFAFRSLGDSGSSRDYIYHAYDWFGRSGAAIQGLGRVLLGTDPMSTPGADDSGLYTNDPRLYQTTLDLSGYSDKSVRSLTFSGTSADRTNIMAISGAVVPEPMTFGVLGMSSLMILRRRRH